MLTSHEIRRGGGNRIRAWHRPTGQSIENPNDNKIRDLKAQIRGETAARQRAEAEAVSARKEADEARAEANTASQRVSELQEEVEAWKAEVAWHQSTVNELRQANRQYLDKTNMLDSMVTLLTAELEAERAKPKGTTVTRKDQTARIRELEEEALKRRSVIELEIEVEVERRLNKILKGVASR